MTWSDLYVLLIGSSANTVLALICAVQAFIIRHLYRQLMTSTNLRISENKTHAEEILRIVEKLHLVLETIGRSRQ